MGPVAARHVEKPATASAGLFQSDQEHHQHQHDGGQLRRAANIVAFEPDREDSGGQRLYGKIVHSAEIVDGFHHHDGGTRGDGGPCQRQTDPAEPTKGANTKRLRHFLACPGLFAEGCPGQQVDIRIKRR